MSERNTQFYFFAFATLSLFVVSFLVLKPYLGIIFISCVFAATFYPLYQKILSKIPERKSVSALLVIVIIVFAIILPVIFISAGIFSEAVGLYNSIAFGGGAQKAIVYLESLYFKLGSVSFGGTPIDLNIEDYFRDTLVWIIGHFDSVFAVVFKGLLGFILMLVSTYYFLINGEEIRRNIVKWSPLPDGYDEEVLVTLRSSVDAILKGRFVVAVAQGVFMSIGFVIFGIGNPLLWGFIASIASLIPALGTSLITVPASIYLFLTGNIGAGIGLIVWGALAVGLIDDLLSFLILKRKIKIPPLLILFSILGGVQFFGPIGFLAGPVLVSTFLSMMKIYPRIMDLKNQKQ
jgi:predicted PurR-regulated permease PerM